MNQPRQPWSALPKAARQASGVLGLVLVGALLYSVDPARATWLPKCPLYLLTGWHCPGCGSTRATHALLHLDIPWAVSNNPLLVSAAPLVVVFCVWSRWRAGPRWMTAISARWIVLALGVLVAFAVARNIPSHPFNLLAPP